MNVCEAIADDSSVQTEVMNNLSTSRRSLSLKRWGSPLLCFGLGCVVFMGGSKKSVLFGSVMRKLDATGELYGGYDVSSSLELPQWTNSFADVWEPLEMTDTPFFWYIPKSGGSTTAKVWSYCLGLVMASNKGVDTDSNDLSVFTMGNDTTFPHQAKYVNVKTQNEEGIEKCKERQLLESGLADIFSTEHLAFSGQHLFTHSHRARGFVMMRHPVKKIIDQFMDRRNDGTNNTTLDAFVASDAMVENFEVRVLNGITDASVEITEHHLTVAKEILRRKFIVSIFEWFDVGMVRFEKYFGWWQRYDVLNNITINNCHFSIIEGGDHTTSHKIGNGEKIYSSIMSRNWADVELYHYAKILFAEQAKLI